ncbi:toxin [Oleiphilus sp. HI0009]|uniref:BrnT family toxin n=1 Tax=unclassified Oleiphilus TaxID=2631174 RepID=UPI0007C3F585|nr:MULTISPECIES: BrnT family toxin [unclassified Oleiphilus]KZX76055.1 toxin [Oleiphilus sp. HI0009]MCH2158038.1 BrnT family toxin [Oleiphilaceae bacterium]KZX85581.1 toxin [Oleiphilus sp. HI0009]KZY66784.1 toxin [Oleiphilus sp. HI0066]KZY69203.1 toxin [Oleiphilus sp. HI0067]
MYSFEFDPKKSKSNLEKHGIDFVTAQDLWRDVRFVELDAKSTEEPRSLVIGKIGSKHWSAIITYRSKNIRIISVRRSREVEVALYES